MFWNSLVNICKLVCCLHQLLISMGSVSISVDLAICGFNQLPLKIW